MTFRLLHPSPHARPTSAGQLRHCKVCTCLCMRISPVGHRLSAHTPFKLAAPQAHKPQLRLLLPTVCLAGLLSLGSSWGLVCASRDSVPLALTIPLTATIKSSAYASSDQVQVPPGEAPSCLTSMHLLTTAAAPPLSCVCGRAAASRGSLSPLPPSLSCLQLAAPPAQTAVKDPFEPSPDPFSVVVQVPRRPAAAPAPASPLLQSCPPLLRCVWTPYRREMRPKHLPCALGQLWALDLRAPAQHLQAQCPHP